MRIEQAVARSMAQAGITQFLLLHVDPYDEPAVKSALNRVREVMEKLDEEAVGLEYLYGKS